MKARRAPGPVVSPAGWFWISYLLAVGACLLWAFSYWGLL